MGSPRERSGGVFWPAGHCKRCSQDLWASAGEDRLPSVYYSIGGDRLRDDPSEDCAQFPPECSLGFAIADVRSASNRCSILHIVVYLMLCVYCAGCSFCVAVNVCGCVGTFVGVFGRFSCVKVKVKVVVFASGFTTGRNAHSV